MPLPIIVSVMTWTVFIARLQVVVMTFVLLLTGSCEAVPTEPSEMQKGTAVIETMDSGGYTYVKLNVREGGAWYAVPKCEVSVGDLVEIPSADTLEMRNFESKTLQRTFSRIIFATNLMKIGQDGA